MNNANAADILKNANSLGKTRWLSVRQIDLAERCYVAAKEAPLAVEMHTNLGNYDIAYKLARSYMHEGEVGILYINQAQRLESQGKLHEAEKLYLTVQEKDLACVGIAMYYLWI